MTKYAIIAAGGSGVRMGGNIPKQFLELNGRAILWYSVSVFVETFPDINIIVVVPGPYLEQAKEICSGFRQTEFAEGGNSRFQSVKNGLSKVKEESIVFVHDAVRCLVSGELIQRCYQQALDKGSAIPSVAVSDSIRSVEGDMHKVIDRNNIRIIQTPQTFRSDIILPAFSVDDSDRFTDEATVVEAAGQKVYLIKGEYTNIKVTTPVDLLIANSIFKERSSL